MICECGTVMRWRCTNNITNIAKYKCPYCGMIKTEKVEPIKLKITIKKTNEFTEPKYYNYSSDGFEVKKYVDGKQIYFCRTKTEEQAKRIVELLKQCNWDKTQLPRIKKEVIQ